MQMRVYNIHLSYPTQQNLPAFGTYSNMKTNTENVGRQSSPIEDHNLPQFVSSQNTYTRQLKETPQLHLFAQRPLKVSS